LLEALADQAPQVRRRFRRAPERMTGRNYWLRRAGTGERVGLRIPARVGRERRILLVEMWCRGSSR
jgi:hypothetical protein